MAATLICVDGLGGHPETTFGCLKKTLEQMGHKVVLIDTPGVRTHEDRVQLILDEYTLQHGGDIFLVGQSAGGSAVRIAAERLEKLGKCLTGIIQLSPAMPFGIVFMTWPLARVMKGRLWELFLGRSISTTMREYKTLVSPLSQEVEYEIVTSRQPVPGLEGRTLAFNPPRFVGYSFPTLHIFGSEDRWIAPRAQHILSKRLRKRSKTISYEVAGAGHLTLMSEKRNKIFALIQEWIGARSS
jgi:alpha-beta hydrolase superfamily lysophospholipase